jgi:ribonuclease HI
MIYIYTDGASRGNPGKGGYGVVLISGTHRKELAGAFRLTTNNRMELLAAIKGLEALKLTKSEVTIVSDSKYVVDAINQKWIYGWLKKNWKDVKNSDLWVQFWKLYQQHVVTMKWIKGHNAHVENERCDVLATQAADEGPHAIDAAFEAINKS